MSRTIVVPLSSESDAEFKLLLEDLAQLPPKWAVADVASDEESSGTRIGVVVVKKGSSTRRLVFPLSAESATEFDAFIEEWETLKPSWRLIGVDRAIDSGVPVARFTIEPIGDEEAGAASDRSAAPAKRSPKPKRATTKTARKNARGGGS